MFNVQAQVDRLQTQIDARARQAADAVRQKRPKELALLHLRARRALEAVLTKRIGALDNLQNTLLQVEAAAGDVEVRLPHLFLYPFVFDQAVMRLTATRS